MENKLIVNFDYSKLKTSLYVGEFIAQLVRLNFTLNEIDTFVPLIDDKAIDFISRVNGRTYYGVQEKDRYFYETKEKWGAEIRENLLIAFVILQSNINPTLLLIPGNKWKAESLKNKIFCDRNYDGKKSKPEWGLTISKKNLEYLIPNFEIDLVLESLKRHANHSFSSL